jgi:hypothetical protein
MNNDAAAIWLVAPENQVGRTRRTPESMLSARATSPLARDSGPLRRTRNHAVLSGDPTNADNDHRRANFDVESSVLLPIASAVGMGVSFSVRTHPNGLAELGNFPQLIAT